ncbi:MAG: DUF2971 domain-containing protein [Alphaproteobacteria bacterium]|nr:DUF2971 domain-containing protein [Alphaproteobacteria bacterium]MBU1561849.1 DUF2971 domain-containing protein [Alphaproteobacteria bacterium]MBU2304553.1 DUF2971 domain-containing protein [Alphaproteobacteria bacterium]MBU2367760.1 DUF2971 domain-containing protein [Alphaproteobacteria bacterium]
MAHYTTAFVLEQMVKNNEIWFGNPLLMNDVEEVRFGINEGTRAFLNSPEIRHAFQNSEDAEAFEKELLAAHANFDENHAFDTYILCFCEHDRANEDGLLSMWRGYGDSGKGAAVIFDGRTLLNTPESPLIVAKVEYASVEDRRAWFARAAEKFANIVSREQLAGEEIGGAAWALFARLRLFSLFTKHSGFLEEKEWRLAYMPERDVGKNLTEYLSYHNGPRGIEPKLKLPFAPNAAFGNQDISLNSLVHSIILGPTASTPLAVRSVQRMLNKLGHSDLSAKVIGSQIPYRSY